MTKPPLTLQWTFSVWTMLMFLGQTAVLVATATYFLADLENQIHDTQKQALTNKTDILAAVTLARGTELRQSITETKLESIDRGISRIERLVEALYNERRSDPPPRQ